MRTKKTRVFSFGNRKLPKYIAIFNMASAQDCPSRAKGMCQAYVNGKCVCYALKPEQMWPRVAAHRKRQANFWDECVKKCDVKGFVQRMDSEYSLKNIKYLRLNEAGDFRSQQDVDFTMLLAEYLKLYGIGVYCYTARKDLDYSIMDTNPFKPFGMRVFGSGFWKPGMAGTFTFAETEDKVPDGEFVCPGDCRKCCICRRGPYYMNVVTIKHGRM